MDVLLNPEVEHRIRTARMRYLNGLSRRTPEEDAELRRLSQQNEHYDAVTAAPKHHDAATAGAKPEQPHLHPAGLGSCWSGG